MPSVRRLLPSGLVGVRAWNTSRPYCLILASDAVLGRCVALVIEKNLARANRLRIGGDGYC